MLSLLLAASVATLSNWEFSRTGEDWAAVSVPHDWAIAGPFDPAIDRQTVAIFQNGEKRATEKTGRTGSLPWIGRGEYRTTVTLPGGVSSAALVFEGAMSEPEVFWDGEKIGEWKLGYATFAARVPAGRAAAGAHRVRVTLRNRPESSRWYPGGGLIRPVRLVLDAEDPEAAVLARPHLRARLPKVEVRRDDGFYIDGRKVKFQGVCLHHDLGPLGAAWNKEAFRRQVRKLKDIGVNAIRTAHNPPHSEQLDVCDEEGVWVMAESFDMWESPKCRNGYSAFFGAWWRRDLEQLVKVCRDHPCVVMYSIGNEVCEQSDAAGLAWTRRLQDCMHALDPTRPVTQGLDRWPGPIASGVAAEMDVVGLNYRLGFYDAARKASRAGVVLGSETASSFSSRGCYYLPVVEKAQGTAYRADGQCSDYDVECAPWANLPDDDRAMQEDNPRAIGEFVWTGFDYLGEPTPYDTFAPSRSSYFGIFDLAGLPKNRAYLYRSFWNTADHTLHLLPHWNWKAGDRVPVVAYTDFDAAELFLNGRSLGRRAKDRGGRLSRYRLWWRDVPFEPGELKVVAYGPSGEAAMTASVRTAGPLARYEQEAETWGDLVYVTVRAVDANGTLLPDADDDLAFEVAGDARFKAACNGDATSHQSFALPRMRLFHGQLVVVLEKTGGGAYTLSVRASARLGACFRRKIPPCAVGTEYATMLRTTRKVAALKPHNNNSAKGVKHEHTITDDCCPRCDGRYWTWMGARP